LRGCEKTVASGPRARRTARSDETYQIDRRGASTAQRRYRVAQQVFSQALSRAAKWVRGKVLDGHGESSSVP
ncbi:MAG: hypothetical protein ACFCVA_10910, partial [Gammaproteobacteria bacterium]